mgnify:CR=1 FL=1
MPEYQQIKITPAPNTDGRRVTPTKTYRRAVSPKRQDTTLDCIMRKILLIQLFIIYSLTVLSGQSACDFINIVQEYQKNIKLKLRSGQTVIDSSTFDIQTYMNLYNRLKIDSGKVCDIYYKPGILEGEPIIYVIPNSLNISLHIKEKKQKIIRERPLLLEKIQDTTGLYESLCYDFFNNPKIRAQNNITPENTESGLVQLLFFYEMGEQFALIGHSNYDQKKILCNEDDLLKTIKIYTDNPMFKVTKKKLNFIKKLNITPVIISDDLTCKITWYELWTHSGLFRRSYEIERKPPYRIKFLKSEEIFIIDLNFSY